MARLYYSITYKAARVRRAARTCGTHGRWLRLLTTAAAILALAQRPGDRLYVLVAPAAAAAKTCALDRIDWEARRVDRLPLNLPCPGREAHEPSAS
jgi:hypothetical protein